jgi:hypothetical protein
MVSATGTCTVIRTIVRRSLPQLPCLRCSLQKDMVDCIGEFADPRSGLVTPRVWSNATFNFDNLAQALISLFVVVTLNGYTDIMANAMSAPAEKGLAPVPFNNSGEPARHVWLGCRATLAASWTGHALPVPAILLQSAALSDAGAECTECALAVSWRSSGHVTHRELLRDVLPF